MGSSASWETTPLKRKMIKRNPCIVMVWNTKMQESNGWWWFSYTYLESDHCYGIAEQVWTSPGGGTAYYFRWPWSKTTTSAWLVSRHLALLLSSYDFALLSMGYCRIISNKYRPNSTILQGFRIRASAKWIVSAPINYLSMFTQSQRKTHQIIKAHLHLTTAPFTVFCCRVRSIMFNTFSNNTLQMHHLE